MTSRRQFLAQAVAMAMVRPAMGAAGIAQTVLGPLEASRLGVTLPHEHVADAPFYHLPKWPKAQGGAAAFAAAAVEKLNRVRAAGIDTIVDLTPYDVGRDVRFLREMSRKTGLHMIAATGQRFLPPTTAGTVMPSRSVEGLAAFFTKEVAQGIDGTDIKAGVIKIGVVAGEVAALEDIGLRAAVRTAAATGAPIRIHASAARRAGEKIAAILESEGAIPARVSFDHSDDSGDMDYFLGLARRGYCLGMDHVHRGLRAEFQPPFARRAECIKLLADAGFADRLFLSQDVELGGSLLPQDAKEWRDTIDPAEGMLFTTSRLIPYLQQIGVSASDVHVMTVENPRRFFSFA